MLGIGITLIILCYLYYRLVLFNDGPEQWAIYHKDKFHQVTTNLFWGWILLGIVRQFLFGHFW